MVIFWSHLVHNWSLQHFSQDYGPVLQATCGVYGNLIYECRDLEFKVDSEQQIVEKLSRAILFALRELSPEICWEEVAKEIFFHIF